jgi:hypothetical protein
MSNDPQTLPEESPYASPSSSLSALALQKQSIWTKELKSARTVLIVVGVIQLLFGAFMFSRVRDNYYNAVKKEVAKQGPEFVFDKELADQHFDTQKTLIYAMNAIPIAFGVFLFVMAALVFKFPVGVTLTSLIAFVLIHAADVVVDPPSLVKGLIMKIVFVVVLWKAFKSAQAAKAAMEQSGHGFAH